MIALIDTSSFISLVRYYLPFDNQNILYEFIKGKILAGEIIVLDKVIEECKYFSKGIVLEKLEYLKEKSNQTNTSNLIPSNKYFNQVENNFVQPAIRKKLTNEEFEVEKNKFLRSADSSLLLYCQNIEDSVIVTEETEFNNDNKTFKKIPAIGKILNVEVINLPGLLEKYSEINFQFQL